MNPKLRQFLESIGLKANASDTDAVRFWQSLDGENRVKADGLATQADPPAPVAPVTPPAPVAPAAADLDAARKAAREEEVARVREIRGMADTLNLGDEWATGHIVGETSIEAARKDAFAKVSAARKPIRLAVGEDRNLSTIAPAICDALQLRSGMAICEYDSQGMPRTQEQNGRTRLVTREPHARANEFRRPLVEMARHWLGLMGVPGVQMMAPGEIASLALNTRRLREQFGIGPMAGGGGMAPGDFPMLLGTTVNRTLRQAYMETEVTWPIFCRRVTAPDFRQIQRLALSESPDLEEIPSGGPYEYVSLSETKEVYALADYGNIIPLTRRAFINDDLDAFSRIPMLQGSAARRKEEDVAYAPLASTGQTMTEDSTALFDSSGHGNYTSSGTALSVTSLGVAYGLMGIQKGIKDKAIFNIVPKFLIVPRAKETIALQLVSSLVDPAKSNQTPNPFANRLTVIANARRDADSGTAWILAADPGQIDTVEVCFLESQPAPVLEQEVDFDTDGMKFKVRHTVAARAIDYRGLYKNAGA